MKSVYQLLKEGCQITFPLGYVLIGDPSSGYIETMVEGGEGMRHNDGLRSLDKDGTRLALNDAAHFAKLNVQDA